MKKTFLILAFVSIATSVFAQDKLSFFENHILGKDKDPSPFQLSVDAYPFLFLASGGGGSLALEFDNWQIGAIGFSVVPPDFIKNTFFENADNVKVRRNNAVELFANYYLCIEPLFPGQFRCLKLVGLSFYRVTVLDFLSRPIPVFFCPTNHAF